MLSRLIAVGFLCGAAAAFSGDINGAIRITKVLTKKKVTIPQLYERNVAIEEKAPEDSTSTAAAAAELQRVVVYIEGAGPAGKPVSAQLDQRKRKFEPEVVVVPVGSTVAFPNSDPVFHNVFSLSKVKQFDLGNYRMGESRQVKFGEAGIVSVHCHLHPNMAAAVVVTPNAWYARPGEDGRFDLSGLPPGKYTLVAWHKSAGAFRRAVQVTGERSTSIDIEIPVRSE